MELYGIASSRARRALWTLVEAGVEFSFHKVDLAAGDHRKPAFLAINPNGKVPALVDGDLTHRVELRSVLEAEGGTTGAQYSFC